VSIRKTSNKEYRTIGLRVVVLYHESDHNSVGSLSKLRRHFYDLDRKKIVRTFVNTHRETHH
jgi:hypothetical protein